MLQLSVESRNAQLDAIEASIGTSPVLLLRTGTQPATAGTADSGTVLVTINLPSDWMNPAANGSKTMAGSWADNSADAGGFVTIVYINPMALPACCRVRLPWRGFRIHNMLPGIAPSTGPIFTLQRSVERQHRAVVPPEPVTLSLITALHGAMLVMLSALW
jgi:hypothetical protein